MLTIIDSSDIFDRQRTVENNMDCVISPDDLDRLPQTAPMVTNSNSATINAHDIAIITGSEAARTALFAKMIAATMLCGGNYPFAEGMKTHISSARVLWIDAINSIYDTAQLAQDMKRHFNANGKNFKIAALTALGSDQVYYKNVKEVINTTINDHNPNLIIINDLDNLFPNVTMGGAYGFVNYLRNFVATRNAAVCAIGHNLIGKVKKTTGFVGEILYPLATIVYRVSERSKKECAITRVSCYKTFRQCPRDFAFTINDANFPQQVDLPSNTHPDTNEHITDNSCITSALPSTP